MDALLNSLNSSTVIDDESGDALAARALYDPEAFTMLYRAHALAVYRYCHGKLHDRDAAEDATSQTFMHAYAGLRRLENKPFRPWLFAIAHNVVVDAQRKRRTLLPLGDLSFHEAPDPSPESQAIDHEQQDAIQLLLRRLPKRDREVLELRLAGLTGSEIAQTLGCSREAIRAAQYRAVHRMRELFVQGAGEP